MLTRCAAVVSKHKEDSASEEEDEEEEEDDADNLSPYPSVADAYNEDEKEEGVETEVLPVIASSHSVTGRPPAESFLPVEQSILSAGDSGGVQQQEVDAVVAMDLPTTPLGSVRLHKLKIEEQQRHQQRVKAEATRLKKKLGD